VWFHGVYVRTWCLLLSYTYDYMYFYVYLCAYLYMHIHVYIHTSIYPYCRELSSISSWCMYVCVIYVCMCSYMQGRRVRRCLCVQVRDVVRDVEASWLEGCHDSGHHRSMQAGERARVYNDRWQYLFAICLTLSHALSRFRLFALSCACALSRSLSRVFFCLSHFTAYAVTCRIPGSWDIYIHIMYTHTRTPNHAHICVHMYVYRIFLEWMPMRVYTDIYVCRCTYIYIYMYIYIYIYIWTHTHTYTYIQVYTSIMYICMYIELDTSTLSKHVFIYICIYIYTYIYIYIFVYIHTFVHIYVHIHIHIYRQNLDKATMC